MTLTLENLEVDGRQGVAAMGRHGFLLPPGRPLLTANLWIRNQKPEEFLRKPRNPTSLVSTSFAGLRSGTKPTNG